MSMSCGQLRDYLSLRCISVSGTKAELVARAFTAWEQRIPISLQTSALKKKLDDEYESRLKLGNIPDPVKIPSDQWKEDVTIWPLVDMGKIFTFILKHKEFETDYIGRYKAEKAYSYFDSKFVGPVACCLINMDLCILKTEVTPSQKVNDTPRSVWVCVKKNGEIITAWCSCTAGFSQTCNHVIAACYKVEYAISNNLNETACTSMACEWNRSSRKTIRPCKVKDMDLRGASGSQSSRESVQARLAYEPRRPGDDNIGADNIQHFLGKLEGINKKAVLFTGLNMSGRNVSREYPAPIPEIVSAMELDDVEDEELHAKFVEAIAMTDEQCEALEYATRGQENEQWREHRKGRITASNAHVIHTKMNTLMKSRKKNDPIVVSTLVAKTIYGGKDIGYLADIKYGKDNEVNAKKAFYSCEAIKHKKFILENPGI